MLCNIIPVVLILLYTEDVLSQTDTEVTSDEDGVQEILLPMCRNFVPYTLTKLPNSLGHSTQVEVYRHIQGMWMFMDYGCSVNFRRFVCSMYLPKYDPDTQTTSGPCKETCSRSRTRCKPIMKQSRVKWPRQYRCNSFPSKRNDATCLKPIRELRNQVEHTYCTPITIPMCQNVPYSLGSLPNHFLQRSISEITTELDYYQNLINSGCNSNLSFFLCATYMPFCVRNTSPFTIPCQELCLEVLRDCENTHSYMYDGLPWPNKLQCHRFPTADSGYQCVMPGDV